MILPFSQYFDKSKQDKTYFAEKIWKTIDGYKLVSEEDVIDFANNQSRHFGLAYSKIDNMDAKIHTIRQDSKDRWKVGSKIHPVYNNRSKDQYQFAPTFECKGIQQVEINFEFGSTQPVRYINIDEVTYFYKYGDKNPETYETKLVLDFIKNDGFESIKDFESWFKNTDLRHGHTFIGKIIHFTDFKYKTFLI